MHELEKRAIHRAIKDLKTVTALVRANQSPRAVELAAIRRAIDELEIAAHIGSRRSVMACIDLLRLEVEHDAR